MAYGSHFVNFEKVPSLKKNKLVKTIPDELPERYCRSCESPTRVLKLKLCESCYSKPKIRSLYSITEKEQMIRAKWDDKLRKELELEDKVELKIKKSDLYGWAKPQSILSSSAEEL